MADIQAQVPVAHGSEGASPDANGPNTRVPTPAPPYSKAKKPSPKGRFGIPKVLWVWWVLIVHLLLCIAIALIMTLCLDGYLALDRAAGKPWELGTKRFKLRVSEVTTIISANLVVVRICAASWTAVTLWRCAFILMEEGHINLSQLSNMMVFRVPFSWPKTRVGWVVVSVIVLLFPQPFSGPLVTGAVGWTSSSQLQRVTDGDLGVRLSGYNGDSLDHDLAGMFKGDKLFPSNSSNYTSEEIDRIDWNMLVYRSRDMKELPIKGAGLASTMWAAAGEFSAPAKVEPHSRPGGVLCRQRVEYLSAPIPVNSIISNSYLPCISVGNISWKIPPAVIQNMTWSGRESQFSIYNTSLLDYHTPGVAILFDPQQQSLDQMYKNTRPGELLPFPKAEIFNRSLSLLILLDRTSKCNVEALENTTIYGSIAKILPQGSVWSSRLQLPPLCYAYATVEVTAGVVEFDEAEFISAYTLQSRNSKSRSVSQADFRPETWVIPAMVLLPDVMALVSIANTSQIPTWDNLSGFVETLIHQSYLASWGVLRPFSSSQPRWFVSKAEPRLLASVSMFRLWGWFIINMFVPLSALIWYFGVHWGTEREVILDGPLTALLTQVQVVQGVGDVEGLDGGSETKLQVQEVSTLTKDNEAGRIYLSPDASNEVGDGYGRAVLDISAKETGMAV